jgi:hypothetical protein
VFEEVRLVGSELPADERRDLPLGASFVDARARDLRTAANRKANG